jgi:hypothetical protein
MPYRITRHAEDLVWVVMEGHLSLDHAEAYFHELWGLLDTCPRPTDLLFDGRFVGGGSPKARRRTDQIVHHPHLGHLAFVVGEAHLLVFAPLVKLVSGIGMFGSEHEALNYLRAARGLPLVADLELPVDPPAPLAPPPLAPREPAPRSPAAPPDRALPPPPDRALPPPPMSRVPARFHQAAPRSSPPPAPMHHPEPPRLPTFNDLVHGLTQGLHTVARRIEGDG